MIIKPLPYRRIEEIFSFRDIGNIQAVPNHILSTFKQLSDIFNPYFQFIISYKFDPIMNSEKKLRQFYEELFQEAAFINRNAFEALIASVLEAPYGKVNVLTSLFISTGVLENIKYLARSISQRFDYKIQLESGGPTVFRVNLLDLHGIAHHAYTDIGLRCYKRIVDGGTYYFYFTSDLDLDDNYYIVDWMYTISRYLRDV